MKKTAMLTICLLLICATGALAVEELLNKTPVPWPQADLESERSITLPDYFGPAWQEDESFWWRTVNSRHETAHSDNFCYYWRFHNDNSAEEGAYLAMLDGSEIDFIIHWPNGREKDQAVYTYMKLRNGTWVRGALGQYPVIADELWSRDGKNIAVVIMTLAGEEGQVYRRCFTAS